VHGQVLAVGYVYRHGGEAREALFHQLHGLAERLLEGGGLLDDLLQLLPDLLAPLRGLASEVGLPGLVVLPTHRHVHLDATPS
jgi:hypothetical protein